MHSRSEQDGRLKDPETCRPAIDGGRARQLRRRGQLRPISTASGEREASVRLGSSCKPRAGCAAGERPFPVCPAGGSSAPPGASGAKPRGPAAQWGPQRAGRCGRCGRSHGQGSPDAGRGRRTTRHQDHEPERRGGGGRNGRGTCRLRGALVSKYFLGAYQAPGTSRGS